MTLNSVTLLMALAAAAPALAAEGPLVCEAPHEVDVYQQLRRLSLDLRGRAPTIEEYEALDGLREVPLSTFADYLGSEDFRTMMRRYHEALFWPNVSRVAISSINVRLQQRTGEPAMRYANVNRATAYRGDPATACRDVEQTQVDPAFPGQFRPLPSSLQVTTVTLPDGGTQTIRQEGWRWVSPYWAPGTPVKVCAFDAQETPSFVQGTQTIPCATSNTNPTCGCGPGARNCFAAAAVTDAVILASAREQLLLAVDDVVVGGRPYTDLLLSRQAYQNGALAFWKRHLAGNGLLNPTFNAPDPDEPLSDRPFTDPAWVKIDRGGLHAGVLTLPAYLLRFQSDRGRANRFRIDFLCEHFAPSSLGLPQTGCSETTGDLMNRCQCQYCHKTLEPMAAHWAFFAEAGTTQLTDRTAFPLQRNACINSRNGTCTRFYVTQSDAPNPGRFLFLQYDDDHPELRSAATRGPRALAEQAIASGAFARCTVKRLFEHFMKREMKVQGLDTSELALLDELAGGFERQGYNFSSLVGRIVMLPQYRRVR
jgi:hypothetical protein